MSGGDQRSRLWSQVEDTIARWRSGERPDAAAFFERHPEIGARKTLALDLIHEELCLRREAGDTVVASTFIARFPAYRSSVVKMLAVESYGEANPNFAAALGESLWPQVGEDFQGFEIVEPLGRGAMARVYLARETDMGQRPVVVKVSQHGGHEAHLLGKLEHDNIVAAHSVKHDPETGMTVICMPLLGTATGLDLLDAAFRKESAPPASAEVIGQTARRYQPAEVVKEESLKEAIPFARRSYVEGVVWVGQQLATGLAAANTLGVVHRDIKPSNVLLAWSGRPMLLDFNLSSGEDQASDRIGGTVAYMAPERIGLLLDNDAIREEGLDPRPDIFSLGVLLYELLTGRLPVQPMDADGSDEAALRRWQQCRGQSVAPPSQFNREVDPPIDRIVLRCLSVDPAERFQAAAELAGPLADYLGPRARAIRWARRRRRRLLVTGLTAAASLAISGGYWATRPPYHEVQYQEGLRLYDVGRYAAAAEAFTNSLQEEPGSVKALFARGQSNYRLRRYGIAQQDYVKAGKTENRALFWFCAGCCGLYDVSGEDYLGRAMSEGYDEADVYCNLGIWSEGRTGRGTAIRNYRHAISLNKNLQPALLELASALSSDITPRKVELLPEALECINRAVKLGPESKQLYFYATRLHQIEGTSSPESRQLADDYYRRWVEFGGLPDFVKDPVLVPLVEKHRLQNDVRPNRALAAQPNPPRGVLPPETADLSQLPAP